MGARLLRDYAPRIGLEHAFERRPQLEGRLAEQALLAHLVERGLGNYWGYNPVAWFAPVRATAPGLRTISAEPR